MFAESTTKEEAFCLARKDPFQALPVEVMFPSTPAGALAAGPASLSQTPEKALASGKALSLCLPKANASLQMLRQGGAGADTPGKSPCTLINLPLLHL